MLCVSAGVSAGVTGGMLDLYKDLITANEVANKEARLENVCATRGACVLQDVRYDRSVRRKK